MEMCDMLSVLSDHDPHMSVHFHSDRSKNGNGFNATWEAVERETDTIFIDFLSEGKMYMRNVREECKVEKDHIVHTHTDDGA